MTKTNLLSISELYVDKLFGYYTYKIPAEKSDISQLLIIYGDNGSGKTTLLKLMFWLLSTRDKSGYKTKIAETKFRKLFIKFKNGVEIGADRGKKISGGYKYYVKKGSRVIHSLNLKTEADNSISIKEGTADDLKYKEILKFIKEMNISVYYLSDERKILNTRTSTEFEPEVSGRIIINDSDMIFGKDYEKVAVKKMLNEKRLSLEGTIERLIDWIKTKMISGSRTGEKNSQVVITDLIKQISSPIAALKKAKTKDELISEIRIIEEQAKPYVELGLIEAFDSVTIEKSIANSKTTVQLRNLRIILAPYIENINAKLQALERLKNTLNLFISSINEYFINKEVSFNLTKGFTLAQRGGDPINFNFLSSGEKQLLLLFVNTITSAEVATIFIIDEPEISLNVKWQRNLIDTLLKFSSEQKIQYVLSTHSLELLSSNLEKVTKLENPYEGH
jgi:energy-coupling factor transporter ATP-binding protein EcfA2